MSDSEKKLLAVFALLGFLVINLLAFNFAKSKRADVDRQRAEAKKKLEIAEMFRDSREKVTGEMDWLAENEPEPNAAQDVQTGLQQLAERESKSAGLTIKSQKPLPTDTTEGRHYHRAKFQFVVTGTEQSLYQWLDRLNVPSQFRVASQIRLSPNTTDDTKIDCTATVEQWFIPPTP